MNYYSQIFKKFRNSQAKLGKSILMVIFWGMIVCWWLLGANGCSPTVEQSVPARASCCSSLRFIHVDTSYGGVDLWAEYYDQEQILATNLSYGGRFPTTQALQLKSTDVLDNNHNNAFTVKLRENSHVTETALHDMSKTLKLDVNQRYSLWLADTGVNSLILVQDAPLQRLANAGQAAFRFVNVSQMPNLTLEVTDNNGGGGTTSPIAKGQASPYRLVSSGPQRMIVRDANQSGLKRLDNVQLIAGKSYTCYYDGYRIQFYPEQ